VLVAILNGLVGQVMSTDVVNFLEGATQDLGDLVDCSDLIH